jgi:hypothetical protein
VRDSEGTLGGCVRRISVNDVRDKRAGRAAQRRCELGMWSGALEGEPHVARNARASVENLDGVSVMQASTCSPISRERTE